MVYTLTTYNYSLSYTPHKCWDIFMAYLQ